MIDQPVSASFRDPHRWVVFSVICPIYFLVYFHRVSTSVIASDLLAAFDTNASALGFMSSMYFYLYALDQPIVGYLADRIGPRRVIAYWSMTAALGCFIFGMAPSIGWATLGRAMIGFGVGGVYVPTVKAICQWFSEKAFTTMVGLLMSVGNFGAVVAATPLAWAAGTWGWRLTFFLIGGVTMGITILMLAITRDRPPSKNPNASHDDAPDTPSPGLAGTLVCLVLSFLMEAKPMSGD